MGIDDPPEDVGASVTAVGVDVSDHAPVHVVEMAIADLVARDQLIERGERVGRDCGLAGERPGAFDELEDALQIAATEMLQTSTTIRLRGGVEHTPNGISTPRPTGVSVAFSTA